MPGFVRREPEFGMAGPQPSAVRGGTRAVFTLLRRNGYSQEPGCQDITFHGTFRRALFREVGRGSFRPQARLGRDGGDNLVL